MNKKSFIYIVKKVSVFLFFTFALTSSQLSYANPNGGQVTAGSVNFSNPDPNTLNVTQSSPQAIVNWQDFSIQRNEATHFIQPSASSVILNRVVGNGVDPASIQQSNILGTLTANGQVFIVNPAGIFFGPQSQIDVAGLLATTASITDSNFLAGKYQFTDPGRPQGSIVNQGSIIAKQNGLVALLGPYVQNQGLIQAQGGQILLASGSAFTLDFQGDQLINFTIDKETSQAGSGIENTGHLIANGGKIIVSAAVAKGVVDNVINMQGVAQARSVMQQNGSIVLLGGTSGKIFVGGTLNVSGRNAGERGGSIKIVGEEVHVAPTAILDASGVLAGGEILIGGGYKGEMVYPELANADTTLIDSGATLLADATENGDGGTIVAWSNKYTKAQGSFSAKSGSTSGDGGLVETSSHGVLNTDGITVNTSAPAGSSGEWLLDPLNVIISTNATSSGSFGGGNPNSYTPSASSSNVNNMDIQNNLANTSVTITTGSTGSDVGDITVNAPITWNSTNTLSLNAAHFIFLNSGADITAPNGTLKLSAVNNTPPGSANIIPSITSGVTGSPNAAGVQANINVANFTLLQGSWYQNTPTLPTFNVSNNFQISQFITGQVGTPPYNDFYNGQFVRVLGGDGTVSNPFEFTDIFGLQGMATIPFTNNNFALANDIDASKTRFWTALGGANGLSQSLGFTPIARLNSAMNAATFDGQNHMVKDIFIDYRSVTGSGFNSEISLLGVVAGSTIKNVGVTGTIHAGDGFNVAGLVSSTDGTTIENSFADVEITGSSRQVGGLVGLLAEGSTITNSYSGGSIHGAQSVGGLVGQIVLESTIQDSYSTASASATGLVGQTPSEPLVGGLVGSVDDEGGTIIHSYSTGAVTGGAITEGVGGLVGGVIVDDLILDHTFWDTQTSGQIGPIGFLTSVPNGNVIGTATPGCFSTGCATLLSQQTTFTNAPNNWDFSSSGPWAIVNGQSYPYLKTIYSSTPNIFTGTAFSDQGVTPVGGFHKVVLAADGSKLITTTGENGFFYVLTGRSTIPEGGAAVLYMDAASSHGNLAFVPTSGSTINNLSIVPGVFNLTGNTAVSNSLLASAAGSLPSSSNGLFYSASGNNLTFVNDINFDTLTSTTPFIIDGNITLGGTGNFNFGGPVSLTLPINALAVNTGNITFNNTLTGNGHTLFLQGSGSNNDVIFNNAIHSLPLLTTTGVSNITVNGSITLNSPSTTFSVDTGNITFSNTSSIIGNGNDFIVEGSAGNNTFAFNGLFNGVDTLAIFGGGTGNNTVSFANPLAGINALSIDEGSSGHNTIALLGAIANMTDVIINAGSAGNNTVTLPGPITNVGTFNLSGYGSQSFTSLVDNVGTFVLSGAPAGGNTIALTGPISNINTFILNGGTGGNNHITLSGSLNNITSGTINAGPGAGDTLSITGPVNNMFEFNLKGGNSGGNTFALMAPMSNITTLTIEGGGGPNNYFLTGGPFNNVQRTIILDTALSNDVLQVPSSQFIISDLGLMLGVPGINGLFFPTLARPTVVTLIGTGGATTTSGMYIFQSPLTQSLQTDLLAQSTAITDKGLLPVTNTSEDALMNYNLQTDSFVTDNIDELNNLKTIESNCITLGSKQVCQNHGKVE